MFVFEKYLCSDVLLGMSIKQGVELCALKMLLLRFSDVYVETEVHVFRQLM